MKQVNDGGSAYPVSQIRGWTGEGIKNGHAGMSLRDWFAGQDTDVQSNVGPRAVAEILGIEMPEANASHKMWLEFWMNWEAYRKYAYADAMLKQREA